MTPSLFRRAAPLAAALLCLSPALLLLTILGDASWVPRFLGRLHPLVLHFPIGLLGFVMLAEALTVATFGKFRFPVRFPLFVGAATGVLSAVAGYLLMLGDDIQGALVERHLYVGLAFAAVAVATTAVRFAPSFGASARMRWLYRAGLVLTAATMTWTGHLGASITHGDEFLTEHWMGRESRAARAARERAAIPAAGLQAYADIVAPILEARCYNCHDAGRIKGGLRLDSWDDIAFGGDSGAAFVAGDPAGSLMVKLMRLPPHDDEKMPPEDKPQPAPEEIELIELWIAAGAPATGTLGELGADERWLELAGRLPLLLVKARAEGASAAEEPATDEGAD